MQANTENGTNGTATLVDRVALCDALLALVRVLDGKPFHLALAIGDVVMKVSVRPATPALASRGGDRAPAEGVELSDREQAVLRVLAKGEGPLKGCTVATRAGLRYNSHFRDVMSELKEKGLVMVDGDRRYWPTDRPVPDGRDDGPPRKRPAPRQNDNLSNKELAERIAAARAGKAATNGHTIGNLDREGR